MHESGGKPEGGRVVEICWRSQPFWPPVDVADDGTTSPSRSNPWTYLTVPLPAAARNAVSEFVIGSNGVTCALPPPPTYVAVAVGPITTTPLPAKSELRSGSAPSSFFSSVALFSATSFAIAKSSAISACRSGRAGTNGVQFAAAAVQPLFSEP